MSVSTARRRPRIPASELATAPKPPPVVEDDDEGAPDPFAAQEPPPVVKPPEPPATPVVLGDPSVAKDVVFGPEAKEVILNLPAMSGSGKIAPSSDELLFINAAANKMAAKLKSPPWRQQHKLAQVSMPCLFYARGIREDGAHPAIITRKGDNPHAVYLTVFMSGSAERTRAIYGCFEGVRHIDDPDYNVADRSTIGAWELPPWLQMVLATVQDARSH